MSGKTVASLLSVARCLAESPQKPRIPNPTIRQSDSEIGVIFPTLRPPLDAPWRGDTTGAPVAGLRKNSRLLHSDNGRLPGGSPSNHLGSENALRNPSSRLTFSILKSVATADPT